MDQLQVREIRHRLGLSQERFARLVGVSLQSVWRWEAGLSKPLPVLTARLEALRTTRDSPATTTGGSGMRQEQKAGGAAGELTLGGLVRGIAGFVDLITKMEASGEQEIERAGSVQGSGGALKGMYGFTVRLGLAGEPVLERFGNIQGNEAGSVITATREPVVDILEEEDCVVVILELPGITEGDIAVSLRGGVLEVTAASGDRQYAKELVLRPAVDPGSLAWSYRNGILEVRIAKARDARATG